MIENEKNEERNKDGNTRNNEIDKTESLNSNKQN